MKYILVLAIAFLALTSCRKDEPKPIDYREAYIGTYDFHLVSNSWMMGQPTVTNEWDYQGWIRPFNLEYLNPNENIESLTIDSTLTIHYDEDAYLNNGINEKGELLSVYCQYASFDSLGLIHFYSNCGSGLGGGSNLTVSGIKQ